MSATQESLMKAYETRLRASGMAWTQNETKLQLFMIGVQKTLQGGNSFDRTGKNFKLALQDVGLSSRTTLKALHMLPHAAGEA